MRHLAFILLSVMAAGLGISGCSSMAPTAQDPTCEASDRAPASARQCGELFARDAKLFRYLQTVHVKESTGIEWESQHLKKSSPQSIERMRTIIDQILDPQHDLNREIDSYQKELGQKGQAAFWDRYFPMYDGILNYSEGYVGIFKRASEFLATRGRIYDYGFGTGNGAATLAYLQPTRELNGIDFSNAGLERAKKKLAAVSRESGAPVAKLNIGDLTAFSAKQDSIDGALMNNVLYAIPESERPKLLAKIFSELKPGARLVLSDPIRDIQSKPNFMRKLFGSVFFSSIRNGSTMTEFDFAYFAYLNKKFLMGDGQFLTPNELADLGRNAGFRIVTQEPSYYGAASLTVLEKPTP